MAWFSGSFGFLLVGERERLAGARIVDLDARAFAAAARRVDQLGGAGARFLGQEADPELFASRLENRVLGVGILREQAVERRRRTQRPVGIGAAGNGLSGRCWAVVATRPKVITASAAVRVRRSGIRMRPS